MLDSIALRYYRFLRIPSKMSRYISVLYPFYILFIISIDLLSCTITTYCDTIIFIVIAIHISFFSLTPLIIKYLVPYMRRRQILNLITFSTAPGILIELLGSFIKAYGMLYVMLPLFGLLILRGLTNSKKAFLSMLFIPIVLEAFFIIFIDGFSIIGASFRIFMLTIILVSSIHLNHTLSSYKRELNVFGLSSAWAKYVLTGMDDEIESQMNEFSEKRNVKIYSILFHRKNNDIALIVPGIHFGPFKTLGSTLLPHYLDETLSAKGIRTFVLHGAGSHELDLTNKNEARKLSINIANKVFKNFNTDRFEVVYEPFRVYDGLHEAFVFQTNYLVLIAISSPILGGDDIPYEVQKYAEEIAPIYGFRDAVIIDCHNIEGLREHDPSKFIPIVIASISIRRKTCNNFKTGYGEVHVHGNIKGLCVNKVKVLTMDCDDVRYSLIYLYGNNAKMGVRDSLRRIAINNGIRDAEVITLDDHSCSGTAFDSPYYAVELNEDIMGAVEKALKISINDLSESKVSLMVYDSEVGVAGFKIFELLELAKKIGGYVTRYLKLNLIIVHAVLFMLVLLINLL